MAGILDQVDQRTRLAGHNWLELLLFKVGTPQRFGINVFKVQEVVRCPALTQLPKAHPVVCGITHWRGKTLAMMDLARAIDAKPLPRDGSGYAIITEYNRSIQGFLVSAVDRIINVDWGARIGADRFLAKYDPDELSALVQHRLKEHLAEQGLEAA